LDAIILFIIITNFNCNIIIAVLFFEFVLIYKLKLVGAPSIYFIWEVQLSHDISMFPVLFFPIIHSTCCSVIGKIGTLIYSICCVTTFFVFMTFQARMFDASMFTFSFQAELYVVCVIYAKHQAEKIDYGRERACKASCS